MMNPDDSPTPPATDDHSRGTMTTTTEAARLLGYASTKGISQRIQRGRIPGAVKEGGTWFVPVEWVRKEQQGVNALPKSGGGITRSFADGNQSNSGCVTHLTSQGSDDHPEAGGVTQHKSLLSDDLPEAGGVASTDLPPHHSPSLTPMQQYAHSLARLVDKLETLHSVRKKIGDAVYERQRKHDGYYISQPDESCSKYKCNWSGWCIFYRSKGCPTYDEATHSEYKHAVSRTFYEEHEGKLPLLKYPPCLCHPE